MKKNLIIISAGKFGRETFAWATQAIAHGAPWRIKGFLDKRSNALDGFGCDAPILGAVEDYRIQEGDVFIGAIGDPKDKVKYYTPILEGGGTFVNLIHPLANVGENVRFGVGVLIAPFSSITTDVTVGNFVSVLPFSNLAHDAVIGDWCQICGHCGVNGNAVLDEGVFLGSHTCIIPRVKIGSWAHVGAGSVVVREVQPGLKVAGNPARAFMKIESAANEKQV